MSIEAVALPPRSIGVPVSTIWSLDSNEKAGDVSEKDYQRCSKDSDVSSNRTVCCRETKGQDERRLINPDILRDLIIGFSDGISVPFALASGLSALGNTKIVVISVTAELLSGAIAMGIGESFPSFPFSSLPSLSLVLRLIWTITDIVTSRWIPRRSGRS